MPLIDSVVDSVANTNFKTIGEAPAFYESLAMSDAVGHQRRINAITEAALGSVIKGIIEMDVSEAIATKQATTGNAVAEQISSLGIAVAGLQQLIKGAQSTPPETAKP